MFRVSTLLLLAVLPAILADPPHVVDRGDILQQVRERGSLAAAKSANLNAPNITLPGNAKLTIKWVIDDGAMVKKGDKLLTLDDSFVRDIIAQQQVLTEQAGAALATAQREMQFAELVTRREVRGAAAALELAELVMKNSTEAEALAKRRLVLKVKQADLAVQRAHAAIKGEPDATTKLGIQTLELEREAAEIDLRQFELSAATTRKQLEARLDETRDGVEMAKARAEQRQSQAQAGVAASKTAFDLEKSKLDASVNDLANLMLVAPFDGMAVIWASEAANRGPVIAVGEPVSAGHVLLNVVDLTGEFKVITRVPEAQIASVRRGQPVQVRVDAFPDRALSGKVADVAAIASGADWRRKDVKGYPVTVTLEKAELSLKPNMSAELIIAVGEASNVLRVPVKCIVRTGRRTTCALDAADGIREVDVKLGVSDGTLVEVKEGLKEGDKLLAPVKR